MFTQNHNSKKNYRQKKYSSDCLNNLCLKCTLNILKNIANEGNNKLFSHFKYFKCRC